MNRHITSLLVVSALILASVPAAAQTAPPDSWKITVDPIVGVQVRTPENGKRWHAQVYTEIGGFGVGSTFPWQVFPTVGVNLADWSSMSSDTAGSTSTTRPARA